MINEEEFENLKKEVQEMRELLNRDDYPLSLLLKSAIENTVFSIISSEGFQFPKFTVARDVTVNPPLDSEIWIEDVGGTRSICTFIVNETTGAGTKYSVTVT